MRQLVPKFVIALLLAAICALVLPRRVVYQVVGGAAAVILSFGPSATIELDEDGVPIVDYGNWHGVHIGRQRNPVTISQRAMAYHDLYQNGDQSYLQPFLNCANWLQSAAVPHGEFSLLEYQFPWPQYQPTPPWRSAMAQGRALQVLVRAHQLTNDDSYLESARRLLNAFFVDFEHGGATMRSEQNGWRYKEYAGVGGPESRILNGMTFTVLGIPDNMRYTGDPDVQYLFAQAALALKG